MKSIASCLVLMFLFTLTAGCAEKHKYIQVDKKKYLVYTQPPLDPMRNNPVPEPTYCTKMVDVDYDPPLSKEWYHYVTFSEPDKTFKGCGEREWEQKEGIWIANVQYEESIIEKTSPMIHGLLFAGATLGAAQILGSHIAGGLKHQPGLFAGSNVGVSTLNNFSPGTVPTVFGPPVVR